MIGSKLTIKPFSDSQINFQEKKSFLDELRRSTQNLFLVPDQRTPYFYWFIAFLKIFFDVGHFLKSLWNFCPYCLCFMLCFFGQEVYRILAPLPGIKPILPALEGDVLTPGLPGKSLLLIFLGSSNSTVIDSSYLIFSGKLKGYYHISVILNNHRSVILSSPELNV